MPGDEKVAITSSDGRAMARMRDYRPYLESAWRDDFDTIAIVADVTKAADTEHMAEGAVAAGLPRAVPAAFPDCETLMKEMQAEVCRTQLTIGACPVLDADADLGRP
jgi:hypothetical protein